MHNYNPAELWFVVEWDGEGSYSEVRSQWILEDNPCVGDHVRVKEGKNTFTGVVREKGEPHVVMALIITCKCETKFPL
jgi:hypothetical protein